MSDAFKFELHQKLIRGCGKAFPQKNGQTVQQDVAKIWKKIKANWKTKTEITAATEKHPSEWKQIELKKKGTLFSFWSKVISFNISYCFHRDSNKIY